MIDWRKYFLPGQRLATFLVAASFFYAQNQYFGWNPHAGSDAELIAEGITSVLVALWVITWGNHHD